MDKTDKNQICGVCGEDYSQARKGNGVLTWRYKYRAAVAVAYIHQFGFESPSVLDIGCADGLTLLEMKKKMPDGNFCGAELSESLVDIARSKGVNVFHADVCRLTKEDFHDNTYDVVTAMAVLEHLPYPELAGKEIFRILKPGGLLIATCPDPGWEIISKKMGLFKDEAHYSHFDKKMFQRFAIQCGMKLESYSKFMSAPLGFLPYLKLPLPVRFAHFVDQSINALKIFDWCFVNQVSVLRKI
jgi:SAM-dependent methyltransferase